MSRIVQSTGIVIRRMNYSESSMIVDVLTETHGLIGCIVSGVRKKNPRMSPVLFTPGYIIQLVFYENDPRKLWRIKEAAIEFHYRRTPFDIIRGNTALCICEMVKKVVHSHDPNPELFHLTTAYLRLLDHMDSPANIFAHFLAHFSIQMGFEPKERSGEDHVYFDLKTGWFGSRLPVHPLVLDSRASDLLYQILNSEREQMENVKMSRAERQELTEGLIDYIRYHSHSFTQIRSYDILKKIW